MEARARAAAALSGFCFAGYGGPFLERGGVKHPAAAHLCTVLVPAWFLPDGTQNRKVRSHIWTEPFILCMVTKGSWLFPSALSYGWVSITCPKGRHRSSDVLMKSQTGIWGLKSRLAASRGQFLQPKLFYAPMRTWAFQSICISHLSRSRFSSRAVEHRPSHRRPLILITFCSSKAIPSALPNR